MRPGRLIAVVGPSGVGKDSVIVGIHSALPDLHLVRRIITRSRELGGEDYESVSVSEFQKLINQNAFAAHWGAHGLFYGIPVNVMGHLHSGTDCIANFSRTALSEASAIFPRLTVLNITAKPETLARRLAERGRESRDAIEKRLQRVTQPLPSDLDVIHLSNDGLLTDTISSAIALLQPVSA